MTDTPRIPYWHVYVGPEGVSRQAQFDIRDFELKGVSPGVTPQWNDKMAPSQGLSSFYFYMRRPVDMSSVCSMEIAHFCLHDAINSDCYIRASFPARPPELRKKCGVK